MKRFLLIVAAFLIACSDSTDNNVTTVRMINGSPELEQIARSQFEDLHRIAAEKWNYSGFRKNYVVEIVPHSPECEDPIGFLLPPIPVSPESPYAAYDGSIWDKDGVVNGIVVMCAGGRYLPESGTIVVTETGLRTQPVARFEGEHQLLRQVDFQRYQATLIHSATNPHPILGN